MISNIEFGLGKISVYDTMYSNIDEETKKLICSVTNCEADIALETVQKQEGGRTVESLLLQYALLYYLGLILSSLSLLKLYLDHI